MASPYDSQWQRTRLVILDRDGYRCRIELSGCTGAATQVDHVVPLNEGGARLDPDNLRAACRGCNVRRNARRTKELASALAAQSAPNVREW